jgi:nucleoside-diphosphate-sugar epimerase
LPVSERTSDRPITVYDVHKKMAEEYLTFGARQGSVRSVALRLTNVYGPGPSVGQPDRGVLNQMIANALGGNALTIHGQGNVLRDYLYVEDAVAAFTAAATHIDSLNGRHFVVGSGRGHTVAAAIRLVAARVAASTGERVRVEHVAPRETALTIDARNFVADSGRFREITGWRPRVALAQGIDRTIASITGRPRAART